MFLFQSHVNFVIGLVCSVFRVSMAVKACRQTPPNHPNTPKHPLNEHLPPKITNKQENVKNKNSATPQRRPSVTSFLHTF
jgi:hypothetical protein